MPKGKGMPRGQQAEPETQRGVRGSSWQSRPAGQQPRPTGELFFLLYVKFQSLKKHRKLSSKKLDPVHLPHAGNVSIMPHCQAGGRGFWYISSN